VFYQATADEIGGCFFSDSRCVRISLRIFWKLPEAVHVDSWSWHVLSLIIMHKANLSTHVKSVDCSTCFNKRPTATKHCCTLPAAKVLVTTGNGILSITSQLLNTKVLVTTGNGILSITSQLLNTTEQKITTLNLPIKTVTIVRDKDMRLYFEDVIKKTPNCWHLKYAQCTHAKHFTHISPSYSKIITKTYWDSVLNHINN